jgi:dCMP deaminase
MPRLAHDEYFLTMLQLVSARSTCRRRSVGAIIVNFQHQILSTGYNGVPRGFDHCIDRACPGAGDPSGDTRRCEAVHAEVNALLQCPRHDLVHTMYVSCTPCFECAKMICNTAMQRIVCLAPYPGTGSQILTRGGVEIVVVNP